MDSTDTTKQRGSSTALGVLLIVVGALLLSWPAATANVLVVLFAAGAVAYGVSELGSVFAGEGESLELVAGLVAILATGGGILVAVVPLATSVSARPVLGLFWVALGVAELLGAIISRGEHVVRVLIGVTSLAAGIIVLVATSLSLIVLVWFAGVWLLLVGLVLVGVGLLRSSLARGRGARSAP